MRDKVPEKVVAFCVIGRHTGPECEQRKGKAILPHGWRMVRVQLQSGQYVYFRESSVQVVCCPDHFAQGEPALQ
jgi:hypothetical protein